MKGDFNLNINLEEYQSIKEIHIVVNDELLLGAKREGIIEKDAFPIGCVFKSFLSVLLGVAIKEGRINSIEDCILDYIDYDDIMDINWYKLKIKHALSNTTGLIWPGPEEKIPENMHEVLKLNFASEPGLVFKYKPDPQIIVYLLEKIYECDIVKLFERKIVSSFKHKDYIWHSDNIQGMQVSIGMLDELGHLMLNKGSINGCELFSEQYYEQCITKYSNGGFPENSAYGLGWWIDIVQGVFVVYAAGFGGQRVLFVPEKEMSISLLSDMDRPHPEYFEIVEQLIVL